MSVVYLLRGEASAQQVLLGEKLTGLGRGKIVGPGGKKEGQETPEQTAVREVWEEVGIRIAPEALRPMARIQYPFLGREQLSQKSHAFVARDFQGDPRSSEELNPAWWELSRMPLDRMWADARLWLPRALAGEFLEATFEITAANLVHSSQMTWRHSAEANPKFLS